MRSAVCGTHSSRSCAFMNFRAELLFWEFYFQYVILFFFRQLESENPTVRWSSGTLIEVCYYMHNIIVQYFFIIPRIIRYTKYPCSFFHNSTYPYMVNECNNKSLRKFLNFSVLVNINKNQLSTESAKSEERKQNFMFDTEAFSGVPHRYRWSQGLNCVNSHKLCALSYFCDASRIIKYCKLRSFKVGARLIDFIRAISRLRRLMKCVEKSALRAIHKIDDWKYEKCVLERKFQRHSVIILLFAVTSSRKYISK